MTRDELTAFEADIAAEFNAGHIRAPVHLSGGNEDQLIDGFKSIRPQDWVLGSWRSHYHCLLKGVPPAELKAEIMAGRSIALCFPQHRIYSSAIVGGSIPIAVGVAMAIARSGENAWVYCFMGDMTYRCGIVREAIAYSRNHGLPIHFVVEDNGLSVCTPTHDAWGLDGRDKSDYTLTYYRYHLNPWPHAGAGQRVQF